MAAEVEQGGRERREASRSPVLHFTRYQASREGVLINAIKGEAFIVNISEGGVCFFLDRELQQGGVIRFTLPPAYSKDQIWSLAEIKWIQAVPWEEGCFAGSEFVT